MVVADASARWWKFEILGIADAKRVEQASKVSKERKRAIFILSREAKALYFRVNVCF